MNTATQGLDIVIGARTQQANVALQALQGFLQGIGMAAANFAGRAARALAGLTVEALHTADEMGKLAQKAGVAVEKFSAVAYAAKLSDVSLGTLQTGFKGLSQWMERNGQVSRDVLEVMLEQSDRLAGMADGAAKTTLAMELFGRAGQEMIPLLNQGADAIREQMEEAKRFGLVVRADAARSAEIFNDRLTTMRSRLEGVSLQLAEKVLPQLGRLTDIMMATADAGGPIVELLKSVTEFLASQFVLQIERASTAITLASGAVQGFFTALQEGKSLGEAFTQMQVQAALTFSTFSSQMAKYRKDREGANDEEKKAGDGVPKLATAYDTLAQSLKGMALIASTSTGETRLVALHKELELLDQMTSQVGPATQVAADGMMRYTEEGLKNAQRLLELEQERAAVNQEIDRTLEDMAAQAQARQQALFDASFAGQLKANIDAMGTAMQRLANFATNVVVGAMQGLSGALTEVIMGTKTAGQAFAQFGTSLLTNFIASVLEMILIAKVAIPLLTYLGILSGGATAGTGLGVTLAAIGAGGAAISGMMATAASGGLAVGPGSGTSDSLLARISAGEFIMTAAATQSIGAENLAEANRTGRLSSDDGVVLNLAIVASPQAGEDFLRSQEGQKILVDTIRGEVGRYS
ncbi:MAG: hypothetical protein J0L84_00365 [Verrucomicrobia bacterium]|nr:hypothetical protein [Verrucomicrobiota bacterium]